MPWVYQLSFHSSHPHCHLSPSSLPPLHIPPLHAPPLHVLPVHVPPLHIYPPPLPQVLFQGGKFQWQRLENLINLARSGAGGGSSMDLSDTVSDGARVVLLDDRLRRELLLAFTEDNRLHVEVWVWMCGCVGWGVGGRIVCVCVDYVCVWIGYVCMCIERQQQQGKPIEYNDCCPHICVVCDVPTNTTHIPTHVMHLHTHHRKCNVYWHWCKRMWMYLRLCSRQLHVCQALGDKLYWRGLIVCSHHD